METLEERVKRAVTEEIDVVPYNPDWPRMFSIEKEHLLSCLPENILKRIEHFGSTAVPQLCAKPIIDILVEVASLEEAKKVIVPVLTAQGYEYFWRPSFGDDTPPFYAWFLKRGQKGIRTHHIHVVEHDFEHWDRLLFRDYLIEHPAIAREYGRIKIDLAKNHTNDRVSYTREKTDFIVKITQIAKEYYK
ncbi:MAG: GrpB family protein [Bacteroidetes bacterium]|nr:GrpB family protein [Bacteroidota bacterium]